MMVWHIGRANNIPEAGNCDALQVHIPGMLTDCYHSAEFEERLGTMEISNIVSDTLVSN